MEQNVIFYAVFSVLVVSGLSLIGLLTLSMNQKRLKKNLVYMVGFAAGGLLGDAFIHLLPEATEANGFDLTVSLGILLGILFMFVLEKIIHWRHCHYPEDDGEHAHPFAIVNLVGDGVHNFIDGIVIGGAYMVSIPAGIATTLAVILHEIPQEIGDFGVLIQGGFKVKQALLLNLVTALAAVVGALLVILVGMTGNGISSWLVPFAAGNFIYLAGADLIPELHKEVDWKKSSFQLLSIVIGIYVMFLLLGLE